MTRSPVDLNAAMRMLEATVDLSPRFRRLIVDLIGEVAALRHEAAQRERMDA